MRVERRSIRFRSEEWAHTCLRYLQILASSVKFIFIQHFERNEKQVSSHPMFFIQLLNGSEPAGEISTQVKPNTKDIDCDYTKDVIAK